METGGGTLVSTSRGVEISTAWTVDYGEPEEAAEHYGAVINVELPEDAKATILSHAENEIVFLTENEHLNCTSDGVESVVRYLVAPLGHADGERVDVWVTTILPDGSPGEELGRNHGVLMQPIEVSVLIPGAVCSGNAVTSTAN